MSSRLFGLIELLLIFGGVLIFAVYELLSLRRLRRARSAAGRTADAEAHADGCDGRRGIR